MGKSLSYWVHRWETLELRARFYLVMFRINPTVENASALREFYYAKAGATMAALMALTLSDQPVGDLGFIQQANGSAR